MRVSRSIARLVIAGIAAGALLAPGAAAGAKTLVTISGTASPAIIAFTTTPQPLSLSIGVRFTSDVPGQPTGTVTKSTIYFPHGPRVNGALFPSCNPKRLQQLRGQRSACPKGSHLGSGKATGTSPQFPGVVETLAVDVYNGPGGRSLLFYLDGRNPTLISGMIDAPFVALHSHEWGYRLTLNVPHSLQELSPGIFASLLTFTTKVGASVNVREHGRLVRRSFIEALACPPGTLVPVRGVFDFRGGESTTVSSYIGCK